MSLVRAYAFASGSSGNAVLVQTERTNVLIDAGLSVRTLAGHLKRCGVGMADLDGILLTHEHSDHSVGAGPLSRRTGAPIIATVGTLTAYAEREELPFSAQELAVGDALTVGDIAVRAFSVPHDAADPVGFVLETSGQQITYFTDAGSVTPEMRAALRHATFAIVEANHDLDWLWKGSYTPEMKARVASPTGHLSNLDCADLLAERLEEGGSLCVWLAHLSRANNSPALARRSVLERIAQQTRTPVALEIALRDHPSVSWKAGSRAVQLS